MAWRAIEQLRATAESSSGDITQDLLNGLLVDVPEPGTLLLSVAGLLIWASLAAVRSASVQLAEPP